ncbi:uncharacterized protein AC631_05119 [Debaryomyces fabryi]|uniref:Conserved oligomeric Golgi complex subunit 8 n=1 Tax=Debaryomyces fabryi TaxID=58627 RepID=A0A0V1PSC0_9ASCO|nr:uncharacterized protein AC631_05119 [Debaryomyces fabryi]KRZ99126.1 hypothetical protein AC631_05119 [Debaryomyces fabryi]CUM45560.1 unnamed protein product [Debaryomyces fabryi]
MSGILLETLLKDLDPTLTEFLESNSELRQISEQYLVDLLINDDLLCTDTYTTTSKSSNTDVSNVEGQSKTLTEEIAELDLKQREIKMQLASITNNNRDLIIDISNDLTSIREDIRSGFDKEINSMIKILDMEDSNGDKFEIPKNERLNNSMITYNSILSNIDSVLDLLELPTLCKVCILQGNYQESLEISILVQTLVIRFPNLRIFQKIHHQVEQELKLMVKGLIKLLNTNLKQNNILKIFQILNKLDLLNYNTSSAISSSVNITSNKRLQKDKFLKIVYLNARFKFIINELSNLTPLLKFNKLTYLKRYIEIYREFIFNSLSIYYAIFNYSSSSSDVSIKHEEDNLLISQFIKNLAFLLAEEIKKYLPELIAPSDNDDNIDKQTQKDGLILQIIYLCQSLAKYNVDFESLITWELCYRNNAILSEEDWLKNIAKVKKFRA